MRLAAEVDGLGLDERPRRGRAPGGTRQQQHCEHADEEEPADEQAVLRPQPSDNRKLPELGTTHDFAFRFLLEAPATRTPALCVSAGSFTDPLATQ
jgi:hypothetical protein